VAKLEITRPGGDLDYEDAITDILQHLDLNRRMIKNVRSKVVECIKLHDKDFYNLLVHAKIVRDTEHQVSEESLILKELGKDAEAFVKAFQRIHGNGNLHYGVARTFKAFNRYYPNHRIPYEVFQEAIRTCAICQMFRNRYLEGFEEITKVLKPPTFRHSIGIDRLTITPESKDGYTQLIVIVTMYTKLTFANATKDYDAISIARALLMFYSLYGKFDIVRSDAGSDILAQVVDQLLTWLGSIDRIVAITGRSKSCGIEQTNRRILEHLGMLVSDKRVKEYWSDPEYLNLCLFKLNSSYNEEINMSPFTATFGDFDEEHFKFTMNPGDKPAKYIQQLHENMAIINEITHSYQQKLIEERTSSNPPTQLVNRYKENDLVLLRNNKIFKDHKLDPIMLGPYIVTQDQISNDVHIKHATTGETNIVSAKDLNVFHPSVLDDRPAIEQARSAGEKDGDQILIQEILDMIGDPTKRSTLDFKIRFSNNEIVWKPYSQDVAKTIQFEDFIRRRMVLEPYLEPLIYTAKQWKEKYRDKNNSEIVEIAKGTSLYTFLSSFDYNWYQQLNLPNIFPKQYMVQLTSRGRDNSTRIPNKLILHSKLFNESYKINREYLDLYTVAILDDEHHVLVDQDFAKQYKQILE
jgi:hypothetical protein